MLQTITELLWSQVLVYSLVGLGVIFTISSRFVQIRYFLEMFRVIGQAFKHQPGQVSSFQALTLSVAGRVGTGNIAGVAVAITLGGAGAIFWMWVIGLVGMATSFIECTLAQTYKEREPDGLFRGGPATYMKRGLGNKTMGGLFAVLLLLTFGLAFVAVQSFSASASLEDSFGVPTWVTGISLTVITAAIVFGGVKRIAAITEVIVPIMAVAYIFIALLVVVINLDKVPDAIMLIINSAFGLEEAVGGGVGAAIMQGVRRGLFSNEAGLGSAPNVAAVAAVPHPVNQGIVQSLSVFIDTAIICTSTAFIILMSDVYSLGLEDGVVMTQAALGEHVGGWGTYFVSIALLLFTFSSILYNFYLAENSLNFFSKENQTLFNIFKVLMLGLVMWGSMQNLGTVFAFSDLTMALLAVTNLVALALLLKPALRVIRDYDTQSRAGKTPVFNPDDFSDLNIDRSAWTDAAEKLNPKA
jgi:AGCS family alanine or glycine:cation symporter